MLARFREIFDEVDPDVVEEWKLMGSPVWEHDGIMAVGMAFTTIVKLGSMCGASLPDSRSRVNHELAGNQRRAIKLGEGETVDEEALKALIRATLAHNRAKKASNKK
jgi:hypothetical protein